MRRRTRIDANSLILRIFPGRPATRFDNQEKTRPHHAPKIADTKIETQIRANRLIYDFKTLGFDVNATLITA